MSYNPSGYLYTDLATCCTSHFSWMYDTCSGNGGISNGDTGTGTGTGLYFPDWYGTDMCELDIDGSVAPDYMTSNPSGWMKSSLDVCCMYYYMWNYDECLRKTSDDGTMSIAAPCDILTSAIFDTFAPDATRNTLYTYTSFCNAIETWNSDTNNADVFMGATETDRRNELAAFFGNTMHESDNFKASREYDMCQNTTTVDGAVYCNPASYNDEATYEDVYCNSSLTPSTHPDGCNCGLITKSSAAPGYIEANKLFLGRGPIQLSGNYNYYKAGAALNVDLCANPDLVATDPKVAWGTALWFWMTSGGRNNTTPHASVEKGSFGGTLYAINGGNECPALSDFESSVVNRLGDYCTATASLGVDVLSLAGCNGLQTAYDACIQGGNNTHDGCTACNKSVTLPTTSLTKAPTPGPTRSPR